MAEVSIYDPSMLARWKWFWSKKCHSQVTVFMAFLYDHGLLVRWIKYTAIPIVSLEGLQDTLNQKWIVLDLLTLWGLPYYQC